MAVEITEETCTNCGKKYEDAHVVPRAPFAPFWCQECEDKINAECGPGGWVGAVYNAGRREPN